MLQQRAASQTDAQIAQQCDAATRMISEGREEDAIDIFQSALVGTKNARIRAGIFNGIGQIYANRGQMIDADSMFQSAHNLYPESADAIANIGLIHKWRGNLPEADRWLNRALELNPWHSAAQFTQALSVLLAGDYKRGFELYECRFRSSLGGLKKLETCWPEWDLTNGKQVYVYGEQGSGDIFLMLRYARLIKALGVKQSWVVHKSMVPLVKTIVEIDHVAGAGDPLPEFDCHIPAASLARLFETTLNTIPEAILPKPAGVDYGPGFHVGIAWRGSKVQLNDRFRSTNLDAWAPVLDIPGVTFHSLQVDGADEALLYPNICMDEKPADWMETARRVAGLDLVISVDTSMVHLCGSMGVPCWCALHCRPYFVFPLSREDCPWYPSVRLFKQRKEYEWAPVFESIANELKRHPGLV